jgi:sterol desaturase/sphingolipid hydroxylase (fatty acid hydroxylase superfamily)
MNTTSLTDTFLIPKNMMKMFLAPSFGGAIVWLLRDWQTAFQAVMATEIFVFVVLVLAVLIHKE